MSENTDVEFDEIMKKQFANLQETMSDPNKRANLLVQRYVAVLDRMLGGSKNYQADYEELIQIREQATAWGLKFTYMSLVEICEDMSCVIFNEAGYDVADYMENESGLIRSQIKGNIMMVEEQKRFTYDETKWWMFEIGNGKSKGCDKF